MERDCLSTFLSEESRALVKLGLSPSQSKIYLATLQLGKTNVKELSKFTKIAPEDIYKLMPPLLELGLFTKHLTKPVEFSPTEPREAFRLLFANIEKENSILRSEADKALKKISNSLISQSFSSENLDSTFFSATENIEMLTKGAMEAKDTIDFTTRYNLFVYSMNSSKLAPCVKEMNRAAQRGVKYRLLLNKPETAKPLCDLSFELSDARQLVTNENFEYKYLEKPLKCVVVIYDNKRILVETSKDYDVKFTPFLWSDNDILLELCKTYFDKHWDLAYYPSENFTGSAKSKKDRSQPPDSSAQVIFA